MYDIFSLPEFKFPKGFLWGSGVAGHQVEGNNIHSQYWWDENNTDKYEEKSGMACNQYNISGNNLTAVEFPKEAELESTANGSAIKLSVSGSRGKTFCIKFKKSK